MGSSSTIKLAVTGVDRDAGLSKRRGWQLHRGQYFAKRPAQGVTDLRRPETPVSLIRL